EPQLSRLNLRRFARTPDRKRLVVFRIGAPGRTRTSTMFPPPDFESGASTNSATGALVAGTIATRAFGSTAAKSPDGMTLPGRERSAYDRPNRAIFGTGS